MQESITELNMKIKCTSHMDILKVARDGANLVSLFPYSAHSMILLHDKKMLFGLYMFLTGVSANFVR